jgi:hypothetical protein
MPDGPGVLFHPQAISVATFGPTSDLGDAALMCGTTWTAATAWPAANRALYMPVRIEMPMTVFKMAFIVGVQSGNCDVGIYDEKGNRLVSAGSTAVAAAGFQSVDIADTLLAPGIYFLAMNCDNTTATFNKANGVPALLEQICGMQQQAVGAVALPNPATFANPATAYIPALTAYGVVTN